MNVKRFKLPLACLMLATLSACSQKTAQEKGMEMATEKIDLVTGVGKALEAKGSQVGESLAGGMGSVFNGVERGVMKSGRVIAADPTLAAAGLSITRIQDGTSADGAGVLDAYIVAASAANGSLRVLAFDAMDQEIGRKTVPIKRAADEAKYESLAFDKQVKLDDIKKVQFTFKSDTNG